MPSLLLVDTDELGYLRTLRTDLEQAMPEWGVHCVSSADEALRLVDTCHVDIVLADLPFGPESPAEKLFSYLQEHKPDSGRLLVGMPGADSVTRRPWGTIHQTVPRPSSASTVARVLERVFTLRSHLNSPEMSQIVSQIGSLPPLPQNYRELTQILAREDYPQGELIRVLSRDAAVAATVLRVANSAFYGRRLPVTSLELAVMILGTTTVRTLVLTSELFSKVPKRLAREFGIEELYRHSLQVARYARIMAQKAGLQEDTLEDSFSAGLLHDVGKIIFIQTMPDRYREALKLRDDEAIPLHEAEESIFGVSHADVGGHLLGLWGLPDSIVEAALYHHHPMACRVKEITPLPLVYAGNAVDHARRERGPSVVWSSDYESYLQESGAEEILDAWKDIVEMEE